MIWGVLKIRKRFLNFAPLTIDISFPTKGVSFMQKNNQIWYLIHWDILSVNIFINNSFLRRIDLSNNPIPLNWLPFFASHCCFHYFWGTVFTLNLRLLRGMDKMCFSSYVTVEAFKIMCLMGLCWFILVPNMINLKSDKYIPKIHMSTLTETMVEK